MAAIGGGELLAKCLKEYGVKRIFAIPDGTYNIIFKWMRDEGAKAGMAFITPRHEAGGPPRLFLALRGSFAGSARCYGKAKTFFKRRKKFGPQGFGHSL